MIWLLMHLDVRSPIDSKRLDTQVSKSIVWDVWKKRCALSLSYRICGFQACFADICIFWVEGGSEICKFSGLIELTRNISGNHIQRVGIISIVK